MVFKFRVLILSLLFFSVAAGVTGICQCAEPEGDIANVTTFNWNYTSLNWTDLRNANSTIIKDMNLAVNLTRQDDEEMQEVIAGRIREKINQSYSYDSYQDVPDSLRNELFFFIRDSSYQYTGPVSRSNNFSVNVFRIFNDPIVSKPAYLSRDYIVTYNISFIPESENFRMMNTINWYEADATRMIKNLYNSEFGDEIAAAVINFNDVHTGRHMTFLLEASDLERLKDHWSEDENFIRYYDWSSLKTDNEGLVYYENPSDGIDLPSESLPAGDGQNVYVISDSLKGAIKDQSFKLMKSLDDLKKEISEGDIQGTMKVSQELIGKTRDFRSEISEYPVNEDTQPLIDEYLAGLSSLSKYGSYYWYDSFLPGELSCEESIQYLDDGVSRINDVLGMIDEEGYDVEEVQVGTVKPYSNYLPAGMAYHYMDSGENNDISIKVTDYYLKQKILMEDDTEPVYQEPEFGNKYLCVVIDIMHLGYRGGGKSTIQTPSLESYSLYYNGEIYEPFVAGDYTKDLGEMYKQRTLSRLERSESLILFEIKNGGQFDPEMAYVEIDLGSYGKKVWSLSGNLP